MTTRPSLTGCGKTGACVQHRGRAALQGRESRSESVTAFSRCGNYLSRMRVFQQPAKSHVASTGPDARPEVVGDVPRRVLPGGLTVGHGSCDVTYYAVHAQFIGSP